jgi:hypothetical protein
VARRSVLKVCASKRRFGSALEADQAAGPGLKGYHCPACGGYHLTSQAEPAPKPSPGEERKQTFEPSVLGRAKLIRRPSEKPSKRIVTAECLGRAKADGKVMVRIEGVQYETTAAVQPAHLRGRLEPGLKVRVEFCSKPLLVRVVEG